MLVSDGYVSQPESKTEACEVYSAPADADNNMPNAALEKSSLNLLFIALS